MDSEMYIIQGEDSELKLKEKQKNKIYSTNFLGQFMKNSPKKDSNIIEDHRSKINYFDSILF